MNKGDSRSKSIKRVVIGLIAVALVSGIIFGVNYYLQVREYKKLISDISISKVDLSSIPDGTYTGSYDAKMVAAKVQVVVSGHIITNIKILSHKNERGKKAEKIVDEIKSSQSLNVDIISGATNSSKVILQAVQNALASAKKNNL
ncbi:MAG: FMN-binding protein [Bacillota bacterium]|nr:FMN-binding protein [Bacillota bacterium]